MTATYAENIKALQKRVIVPIRRLVVMQSLRVHSGAQLGYYDSGPPAGDSQYSTLVIMHGHTFNAGVCTFESEAFSN